MRLFATAPTPFIDLPDHSAAFRLNSALLLAGSQCADAEEAVEMFEEEQRLLDGGQGHRNDVFKHSRRAQIHARTLVFAVDNFMNMIGAMIEDPDAPATALRTALDGFTAAVPGLRGLRNSLHHIEDRARGLAPGRRPINPTGGAPAGISVSPGSRVMFVGTNISNNVVFCTAATGETVELEVSEKTVRLMVQTLQEVVDAFEWKGPNAPVRIPS